MHSKNKIGIFSEIALPKIIGKPTKEKFQNPLRFKNLNKLGKNSKKNEFNFILSTTETKEITTNELEQSKKVSNDLLKENITNFLNNKKPGNSIDKNIEGALHQNQNLQFHSMKTINPDPSLKKIPMKLLGNFKKLAKIDQKECSKTLILNDISHILDSNSSQNIRNEKYTSGDRYLNSLYSIVGAGNFETNFSKMPETIDDLIKIKDELKSKDELNIFNNNAKYLITDNSLFTIIPKEFFLKYNKEFKNLLNIPSIKQSEKFVEILKTERNIEYPSKRSEVFFNRLYY